MKYYLKALRNFAKISGRAGRKEFWNFFGINFLLSLIIHFQAKIAQFRFEPLKFSLEILTELLGLYLLLILLPLITVTVRRLHDINRTGWWILLHFLQPVGSLILLIMLAGGSTPEKNKYGSPNLTISLETPAPG